MNLHNRTRINFPPMHPPKPNTKQQHPTKNENTPIHRLRINHGRGRPKTEEYRKAPITDTDNIYNHTQNRAQFERAPPDGVVWRRRETFE